MTLAPSTFPPKLREYLAAGECVAFVGAGFAIPCGMPAWTTLLSGLLAEAKKSVTGEIEEVLLRDSLDALQAQRLSTAASGVRRLLSKEEIRRHLADAFDTGKLARLPDAKRARMLARIEHLVLGPWAGVMTTNYDGLIETGYDRFSESARPFRFDGSQSALGNALCLPRTCGGFFVKLHGDTWADHQVLSTADYVQRWMTSPRVRHFLTAVMLRHRLVFIGCSLEDVVLELRFSLWAEFAKALPKAYALLPDNPSNRLRRHELREDAGLDCLLYPVDGDGDHAAVDEFLAECRRCADFRPHEAGNGTLRSLGARDVEGQVNAIGSINRHLLAMIWRQPHSRLKYVDLMDPRFESLLLGSGRPVLLSLPEGERLYRVLFLVALGLVEETVVDASSQFVLTDRTSQHFRRVPPPAD